MTPHPSDDESFVREVRRQAELVRQGRRLGVWHSLALAGAIGWMVSLPAVLGALLGRWLDASFDTGIFWTLLLLGLGLTLGCASAWRYAQRELKG